MPVIGMEPAVKPAVAATKTGVIGVLATVVSIALAAICVLASPKQDQALLAAFGLKYLVGTVGQMMTIAGSGYVLGAGVYLSLVSALVVSASGIVGR
jgi:glutamate racemase